MGQGRPGQAGGLVRGYRREAGLTQRQLADAARVSVGVIRDLEQGRTAHLQAESARRLARALRLDRHRAAELTRVTGGATGAMAPSPPDGLRVGVLGPLRVWCGGASVALGGRMPRAVLGLLALHVGTGLRRTAIIDALWGDDPPASAVAMVQSYVSRLRHLLNPGWPARGPSELLVTVGAGYQLQAGACDVDHVAFAALVSRARDARATGDLTAACEAYAGAIGLWRGEPLADVDALRDHPAVTRLSRDRAEAVAGYAEAASAAGWHDRVLAELQALTAREPLNERAHARLIIALAGSGRQADALTVYAALQRRLNDQLGVLPGAELAEAHARVLRQDIAAQDIAAAVLGTVQAIPARFPGGSRGLAAEPTVPQELPGEARHFVGRAIELTALTRMLDEATEAGGSITVSAIGGTAGVGKTALAVHWAHQVAERFPDGQLFVNLRGYDPGQPVTAAGALARLLAALGVPGRDIPPDEDELAAQYRSLLSSKRMLVVLDNAGSAEQVRPLLPGSPGCAVVVTSRDSLAGLVARDGAQRLDLDVLSQDDAVGLLRVLIGDRADADPHAAAELARQCSRLPLALRVAAELAAARPDVCLAGLADELADQHGRLDLLEAAGDSRTAVRTVFSWSYQHLDDCAARTFRLAALHPGPDLDLYALAALTGTTLEQARRPLEVLTRTHLIHAAGRDRYGLHDLLRAYARELAARDPEAVRRDAMTRLLDHYLHTAAAAMDTLFPAERHRRPAIPPALSPAPPVSSAADVRAWLDAQRACLVAATACAAADGWPGHAIRLAVILYRYLDAGGHYQEAAAIHSCARAAARQAGDRAAEAGALTNLGIAGLRQGRYSRAAGHLQQALDLYREADDQMGQARTQTSLGIISFQQGLYSRAAAHLRQALDLCRELGDQTGQAHNLNNLSLIDLRQGRYSRAAAQLRRALALCRKTGNPTAEVYALANLGCAYLRQGYHQQAAHQLQRALALGRKTGDPVAEAYALTNLGDACRQQCAYQQAKDYYRQALVLCCEFGDRSGEAEALNGLGEAALAARQPDDARSQHAAALSLASQIGDKYQQARAYTGIADSYLATEDSGQAGHYWQEALVLYTDLGGPEAARVRRQLGGCASSAAAASDKPPGARAARRAGPQRR